MLALSDVGEAEGKACCQGARLTCVQKTVWMRAAGAGVPRRRLVGVGADLIVRLGGVPVDNADAVVILRHPRHSPRVEHLTSEST